MVACVLLYPVFDDNLYFQVSFTGNVRKQQKDVATMLRYEGKKSKTFTKVLQILLMYSFIKNINAFLK